ncbi:sulfate transporter [Pseudovirgaria hyperparasitica]|uniref:Sulfate transporter n=1 Tax=Pseudovirgaria hyperparasitica TaxID=470096 RepID=A0A6A6W934_9PEZI|nr:sulfate transporter [Pseudovirgaria hyperparasitica]KAF2758534.1 sulfate transporter [Pseudovirgaria hyperparasitica]
MREHLRRTQAYNLKTLRTSPLAEISGSLGDLGTLLPIMIALTLRGSISLPVTLLFTGAANIVTGVTFGLPLPVQPMKAIAAVALAKHFSLKTMAASGIVMGAVVGALSVLGLLKWVERVVPAAVIRGIQVGAGLSLCISAGASTLIGGLRTAGPWLGDNYIWAFAAALVLLLSIPFPRFPYALVVFVTGLVLAVIRIHTSHDKLELPHRTLGFHTVVPHGADFIEGTFSAALGQLPLTILNSIIAVTSLSNILLASRPTPSTTTVGISIAVMNLVAPWFGGMPACHGSGGLAGQYRFGARSGSSVIILGAVKMMLGGISLRWGHGVARLLGEFPRSILGIMVLAAGIELARAGITPKLSDAEKTDRWMVLLVTVAGLLAFKNDFVGFVAGMLWHWGLKVSRELHNSRNQDESFWSRLRGHSTQNEESRGLLH